MSTNPQAGTSINPQAEDMALRDLFAAGALAAMVQVYTKEGHTASDLAVSAYQYADAMLIARRQMPLRGQI